MPGAERRSKGEAEPDNPAWILTVHWRRQYVSVAAYPQNETSAKCRRRDGSGTSPSRWTRISARGSTSWSRKKNRCSLLSVACFPNLSEQQLVGQWMSRRLVVVSPGQVRRGLRKKTSAQDRHLWILGHRKTVLFLKRRPRLLGSFSLQWDPWLSMLPSHEGLLPPERIILVFSLLSQDWQVSCLQIRYCVEPEPVSKNSVEEGSRFRSGSSHTSYEEYRAGGEVESSSGAAYHPSNRLAASTFFGTTMPHHRSLGFDRRRTGKLHGHCYAGSTACVRKGVCCDEARLSRQQWRLERGVWGRSNSNRTEFDIERVQQRSST